MESLSSCRGRIRSGVFDVDLDSGEMHKSGRRVPLQDQPFRVLAVLLERPGEVITREELEARLWPSDSFVGFDEGINTAIRKLRIAFGDAAANPRFIETIPRRGYRFIAPVSGRYEMPSPSHGVVPPELLSAASQPVSSGEAVNTPKVPAADRKTLTRPRYIAAVLSAFIFLVMLWLSLWRPQAAAPIRVVSFTQLTNDGQAKSGPMATDGTRIYFNERLPGQVRALAQVSVVGGEAARISIPLPRPRVLDLSRDHTEILVGNEEENGSESLWLQPVAGGSPRRVGGILANDAAWGDGQSVIYGRGDDVYLANKEEALPRKLLAAAGAPYSFNLSPDGQELRFSRHNETKESVSIMETTVGGTNLHELFAGCCGKWIADGRYFVFEKKHAGRTDLWALPENGGVPESKRTPIQLTAGPLDFEAPVSGKNSQEIFAIGTLHRAEIVRYDSRSREFVSYLSGISAEGLSFSRDGRWVTYTSYPDGALWRSKIDGSDRLQLTFPPMRVLLPRWSPDGRQIAFVANYPGRPWNIYLLPAEGGTPRQVLPDAPDRMDANWSPDGNSLVFASFDVPNNPISIVDLKTVRISTLPGSIGLFSPRWSPDGRSLCAITSQRPFRLMLFDFTTQKWTELFGSDMGYPSWSHNGRYIYFEQSHNLDHDGSASINRIRISDRKVETVADMKNVGRLITGSFTEWIGLAPDDSPLLSRDISTHEVYALRVGTQ